MGQSRTVVGLAVWLSLGVDGCAHAPGQDGGDGVGARLAVACEQGDAMIFIDDRYVGTAAAVRERPLVLRSGFHRVEVRRQGHVSHLSEVNLEIGATRRLRVRLRREPF